MIQQRRLSQGQNRMMYILSPIANAELDFACELIGGVRDGGGRILLTLFIVSLETCILGVTIGTVLYGVVDIGAYTMVWVIRKLRGGAANA